MRHDLLGITPPLLIGTRIRSNNLGTGTIIIPSHRLLNTDWPHEDNDVAVAWDHPVGSESWIDPKRLFRVHFIFFATQ
jgi:hypothetical protein